MISDKQQNVDAEHMSQSEVMISLERVPVADVAAHQGDATHGDARRGPPTERGKMTK